MLGYSATRTPEALAHKVSSAHWVGYPVDPWLIATREGLLVHSSRALPTNVVRCYGTRITGCANNIDIGRTGFI